MVKYISTYEKLSSLKQDIDSLEELYHYLHIAMEIELATIPAYLCALYSLKPGTNQPARDIIRSVVMEEMLHLTLVANVLNAVGGQSRLNDPEFVPNYPTELPDSDIEFPNGEPFKVPLQKFSREAVKTFMRIEQPEETDSPPEVEGWSSIGQFYHGLIAGLDNLCNKIGVEKVFTGTIESQIRPEDYYGAAGHVIIVADADPAKALIKAKLAFEEIIEQGEGVKNQVFDDDTIPGKHGTEVHVPAHYFRFQELELGKYYQDGDQPNQPTGPDLHIDWDAVFPMTQNSKMRDYPEGSEIHNAMFQFNMTYMELLDLLQIAFSGHRDALTKAVGVMYQLRYKAEALMKVPNPKDPSKTVGPGFEYIPIGPRNRA